MTPAIFSCLLKLISCDVDDTSVLVDGKLLHANNLQNESAGKILLNIGRRQFEGFEKVTILKPEKDRPHISASSPDRLRYLSALFSCTASHIAAIPSVPILFSDIFYKI